MASKSKSAVTAEYNKELKRIKQFLRRAEKRGYRFEAEIIPDKPKRITPASVRRLQRLTPDKLYKKSTALSEEGDIISGTEKRKEERKQVSVKGASTKAKQKAGRSKVKTPKATFEQERTKKDEEERKRIESDTEYREQFKQGELIYQQILEMIRDVAKDHKRAAEHLQAVLEAEISRYGKDKVVEAIGNATKEVIDLASISLYYNPGDSRHDDAIRELVILITGSLPDAEESRQLQEAIDADTYEDSVE